jgi:LmbE family N-acetylglucosaminyl deacetylase
MQNRLRLMAVLAHPDDESLAIGGTLARYADEGVETFLVTATLGEHGRNGHSRDTSPGELARLREAELRAASDVLGITELSLLDYTDGALDRLDPEMAIDKIADHIARVRPHVVVTFGPEGAYGHPDHIAISQFTTAAVVRAARRHWVAKLYYIAWTSGKWDAYESALKRLVSRVDGVDRRAIPWPDWAVTTVLDTARYWPVAWRAISCHQTQISVYENLRGLSPERHRALWGTQEFNRAFSLVNGGRRIENDLFEGLRNSHETAESTGTAPQAELCA